MDIRSIFESVGSDDPIRSAFESVGSNSFDEQKFRSWYAAWAKKAGIDPDPDNPEHYYDYRAAFSAGVEPSIDPADKQYHWPSQFKKEGHPRMVLDGVNTKTGQPVDPIRSAFEAAADRSGPQLGPPTDVRALRGEPTRNVTDAISAVVPQEPANQSFAQDKPVYTEPKLSPRPANVGGPQLSQRPPQIEPKKAVDQGIRQASADTLNFLKALKAKEVRALEERLGADDPLVVKEKAKVWDDSPAGKFQKRLEVEIAQDPLPRPEGFKGYVQDMVRALPQIGASVGATYVGGPAAGMAVTGSMIAGATERELSQARVDGKGRVLPAVKDPERRWKAAIFNAAGQSFLEQLPMSRALAAWKPGAAAKSVIAEMSKTGALEWFTETIQKVPELMSSVWAHGAGKSPSQMLDEFTEGVGQALKEGAYEGAVVAPVSMLIGGAGATMGKIKAGPQPIQADEIETPAQAKAFGIVADKDMTEDLKAARADAIKQRDRLTDLEEPYQDEIVVADLDNKIGLYDEALRNADNMQKVRQAFEDAARQQPEDIGSQIVENEPQTEERLTDEPQTAPQESFDELEDRLINEREQLSTGVAAERGSLAELLHDATVMPVIDHESPDVHRMIAEAYDRNRLDIVEYLVKRIENYAENVGVTPGVSEGSDRYETIKEALTRTKNSAVATAANLRARLEKAKQQHPPALPEDQRTSGQPGSLPEPSPARSVFEAVGAKTGPISDSFKNSKVKDANGELEVVYHGTTEDFTEFKIGAHMMTAPGGQDWTPSAIFFGDEKTADYFAKNRAEKRAFVAGKSGPPRIIPAYLSITNPIDLRDGFDRIADLFPDMLKKGIKIGVENGLNGSPWAAFHGDFGRAFVKAATELGYDGAMFKEKGGITYAVFSPDQIHVIQKPKAGPIPDFRTTNEAVDFGEQATSDQVAQLEQLRAETKARVDELNSVPPQDRDWEALSQETYRGQLYREAIEASRGEHPSQLEAGRPMYWDGDGKTQLSAEDAPAGTTETDQPPQLTSEQRQAVQKIYGAEIPILRTVFGKDLADRISVELKQMIDLGGANADESLANWKARGVKPNTVLGATTFRGQRALMEISLAQDAKRQQWTFDHETFHIAAEWVLPPDQYATVLKAYGGNTEAAADGFARFMNGKSQPPEGIKKIFMQLRELLRRMGNFLRGSGFTSADKIFGDIAAGSYAGKRRAGTGMYQGKAMSADEYAPQWYSQMQKVLEAKLPGSGTPAQIKQALDSWTKKGEFKAEELEWSGVKEWLDQQAGKVTKQQVIDFVAANNVQIKEVVKSAANADSEMLYRNALSNVRFLTGSDTVTDSIEGYLQDGYSPEDAIDGALEMPETVDPELLAAVRMLQNRMGNRLTGAATKYGTYQLPGGDNYREVLLTLPPKGPAVGQRPSDGLRPPQQVYSEPTYSSSHWDEPNVLAHVRFNERTGPDGERILFLEEVQADKGQEWQKLYRKIKDGKATEEDKKRFEFLDKNFPYNKTSSWVQLAFTRMVRYAAENGFDSIAWTPGEVQAERYDLSKQVDSIEWHGYSERGATKIVNIYPNEGNIIEVLINNDGVAIETGSQFDGKPIDEIIGKDIAEKVMSEKNGELSGSGLKVGGEGMKGFYDKILPAEVNSFFGKKAWGNAKVGKVDLPVSRDFRKSNYGITPARDVGVNDNRFVVIDHSYGFNENGIAFGPASAEECRAWVRKEEGLDAPVSAWSLPITPQMRDKALHEGMTLFNLDADNPGGMPPREPYARRPKSKNAVDLPELTEMIKVLNSGKAPKLFQRMRDALGLFQHNDLAGIADVMIDPDLVIGQPIERAVIRLKGKTPAERKVSLVQQMQDFKDSVLSRYNVDPADMVFKSQYHRASGETHLSAIRKDPDVAAKVLSHELGHLDDWWAAAGDAPMVQGRGNILGRIAKLKGYINEYLAEYPGSPDEALTAADIGRLKKEAAKQKLDETTDKIIVEEIIREVPRFAETGVTAETILEIMRGRLPGESNIEVYRFLQTADSQTKKEVVKKALQDIVDERVPQTGRTQVGVDYVKETVTRRQAGKMPTQKEINERFKELLRKEIIKRKLYERMVVMDELKELTQQWKPFDLNMNKKYTAYRHKSSELYADAVSVMLQEPELLKSVAPTFDKAMKMYASVRPDFTETLEGIRKDISGSQIGPRRLSKLYEMYERGEKVIADFYIRNRMEKRSLADTLFLILTDRNHGVLKQIRAAEKSGDPELIAKARKARYELEETQYIASEMSAYVTDTVKNVIDPMMEKGATITDLGAYLFGRHVQANRKDMVSPGGHTSTTVGPMLEALEQKLGPEKYQAVKDAAEKYRKIREKYIIPRIEQSGIASPELLQTIKTRGEYARISVQHWLEEKHGKDITAQIYTPVGGALKAQKGTFSDSINAFTATLMQDISLLRSAHLNKAKTGLLDFLIDAGQVKPAEMKYDKGLGRMAPVRLEDPSRAHLSIMRDGTPYTYDVHRDIAKSFEYSAYESQKATEVINALNAPLRRLLVSNNPVWMIRNIFRDFRTTIKNIPEARVKNLPELAKLYKQAYGEVWEYVWKNNASDDIDALLRGKAITTDRVYGTKEMGYEDEAARIADEFNIQFNPELSKISQQRFKKARQILDVLDRFGRVSELGGKVAGYKFLKSQRDKGFINPKTGGPRTDQEIFHVVRSRIGTPDFKRQGTGQIVTNNLFMFSNVNKEGLRSALESFNEDRSAYVWKTVMYNILPKLVLAAASAQIPWVKEVVDGLTDYQKDHYTVIPIPKRLVPGLGPMDSFAFLIPEDYEGQLAGALVNKIARGEFGGTKGAINEASQLVPYRWHPAISVGADLLTYYVNGMNPVDDFRGSHILPDSIYKAGGLDAHKEMGKYVWNNLGMRLFYNARQGELDPELAPLKEALQFPVLNWLSAIATVTNRGHAERYRRITEPIRKEYDRKAAESEGRIKGHINLMGYDAPRAAKVELYRTLKQEDLLPSEQNFNAFEKRYNRIKNKGKDDQRIVLLEYADTNEEKAALLSLYEMELGAEQYKKLLQNLRRDGIISQETLLKKARGDKNGRNRRTNP